MRVIKTLDLLPAARRIFSSFFFFALSFVMFFSLQRWKREGKRRGIENYFLPDQGAVLKNKMKIISENNRPIFSNIERKCLPEVPYSQLLKKNNLLAENGP